MEQLARVVASVGTLASRIRKTTNMMEIFWGDPLILIDPKDGDVTRFCTIEKVHYWLRRKWPVADAAQQTALAKVEAAMECMNSVDDARNAFLKAARLAGFKQAAMA